MSQPSFDLARFVEDCRAALGQDASGRAVRALVERAVAEPAEVVRALGEPSRAEIQRLYHGPELTVLNVVWAPEMTIAPHDHRMWAVIGIYSGREENSFWRRRPDQEGKIETAGGRSLGEGQAVTLGRDVIHAVSNPLPRFTGALHVYGGDFFAVARSEWNRETLLEGPFDGDKASRLFEEANRRLGIADG
jgi:predicted metal-dependent enzyme (double-stranded beta helix superfamily)